jgi:AraC-like DNA-binding protein
MANVIHLTFNDPRDYERSIRAARVSDLVVSERGIFDATLTIVNVGRVWLQSGTENLARTMHMAIEDLPRSLAYLADDRVAPIIQSGAGFGAGEVVSFGRNTSHFQRTFGPFRWASMSVLPGGLEEALTAMTGKDMGDPWTSLWVKPSAKELTRLRQLHLDVNRMALSGELVLGHPEVCRSLEQTLTTAMVACLAGEADKGHGSGWLRHQRIMLRFREWLDTNNDRAVYLQEICTALNVSAPTLRRCCEEHLGMSPMHYLWLRRMNLARQELRQRHSQSSVTATAMNFGFWHLGRFADEYRSLFGESPGATLTRRKGGRDAANIGEFPDDARTNT